MPGDFRCLRCEHPCAYFTTPSAHGAAGALGTRHSPRPLFTEGRKLGQSSGASRREDEKACLQLRGKAPHTQPSSSAKADDPVIPETSVMESMSRGVLDTRVARGMTAVGGGRAFRAGNGATKRFRLSHSGTMRRIELRCAIAHRRISKFRPWSCGPSRNDGGGSRICPANKLLTLADPDAISPPPGMSGLLALDGMC